MRIDSRLWWVPTWRSKTSTYFIPNYQISPEIHRFFPGASNFVAEPHILPQNREYHPISPLNRISHNILRFGSITSDGVPNTRISSQIVSDLLFSPRTNRSPPCLARHYPDVAHYPRISFQIPRFHSSPTCLTHRSQILPEAPKAQLLPQY